MDLLGRVRGIKGARGMVQAPGPPLLEQLEPRLLLSADLIGTDLLNPLQSSPGEQAIVVDLNQGQEVVQENDCSLVLTYLVSTGEPDSPQADMSDGPSLADTEDAGPGRQPLDDAVRAAKVDDVAALTFVATPLGQVESAVQIATESYGLTAPIEDEPAGLIVSDQQDGMTGSDGFPIEARGPPNGDCDSVSPLCQATYGEEEQPITLAEGGASSTTTSLVAPDLPGLVLLDPDISNWQGQIVYLDFDGEQDAVYNGPVTIGPFDVPAFQPVGELAGQEQVIIDQVLLNLQDIFAGSGVIFATQQPSEGSEYSTIYIGGDDSAFDQYGSFLGLAEQVDVRNTDLADEAFVFGERLGRELPDLASLADKLTCIIAHEAGHLLGYVHQDAAPATSALSHLASSAESYHQVATLTPSGSTIGSNVSIDGDYAVVGDRWDNDKGVRAGAAYVFRRNGTRWVEEAKLYASDCAELDQFGWSVDISGDHIIVGAPGASGSSLGAAYIFKRDNTGWVQEAKLAASDGAGGDEFGASVAIDGAYAVVGAPGVENGYSSGAAYVFGRDGSDWTQQTTLLPSDVEYYNEFGHSVSVSGDYALIGADRLGPCIFRRNGTVWTEEAKLDIPSHQTTIIWPDAVSIDGEYALVGVAQDSDKGGCAGAAYVFKRDGIDWTQQEKLLAPYGAQGDFFGYSVCIDGDYAVVGAIQDDDNGQNSGSAYLFRRSGTYWTEYAKLEPSDADGLSFFGGPVSVSGEFVLVGEAHDSYLFFVPKQERYVVDVYPGRISRSDRAIVHILGGGFDTGMEVTVQDAGGQRTSAETVVLSSANVIIAHFDLSAASLGLYDVCVAWADGHEETTEEALDVRELADGALYSYPDQDLYKDETREYPIEVPDTQNLFVTLQKTTLISYGDSWASELSLLRGRKEIAATSGSHDLMLHVVDPEPGSYTVEVTAQRGGEGHITVWTALPELPLGEWVVGTVFASYGSVWYQVEVPPGQETLYLQAEAMGMWSHFDIYRGQYGSSQHWVSAQGTGTSIEIPNPAPGTYIVEFLDSAMIWVGDQWAEDQSRDVMLKADIEATGEPPPGYLPTIYSVSPEKGGNTGFVTVEIKGGWLDENATVSLVRSGYEDIVAQSVWADDRGLGLTATFDLTDQQPGEWKLILTNPDGQTTTSAKPFVVETGCAEELSLEIVGRTVVRSGRATNYDCLVANHANTNATDVYVLLTVTENESAREQNSPSSYTASFESRLPESAVQAGDDGGGGLLGWLIRKIPPETRKSFRFGYRTAQEGSLTMTLKGGKGIMDACFAEVGMLLSGEDPDAAKAEAQRVYEEHYESVLYEPVTLGEFIKDFAFKFGELVNELFDAAIDLDSLYEDLKDIEEEFSIQEGDYESSLEVIAVGATTPEDKYGPAGYDVDATSVEARQRFVTGDQEFYYRVDFWNKEDATAPAYDVLVEDQLDESLDWGSFRFEEVGFLQWNVDLEPCQYFNVDVDTRPDMDWIVNVEGTFDPDTGLATWRFRTLDPITRQTPDDPMAGFLPPITESGEEIGWVDFTVRPKDGLATGTQIANQAFVEFDHAGDLYNHPAPKEGPWVNTIDAGKPTSSVQALPGEMASGTIVSWAGQDDENGSGIATYTIYVSDDEGPWEIWLAGTAETSAAFTGEVGHSYGFRSVARDNVGHVEDDPGVVEASTVIVAAEGPPLYGVCYGPFREGQSPELGIFPTEEQVEQDISIIAGMASAARTYGIDNVLGEIPRICDQYGVGCYAGGWISGDPTWDQQTVSDLIALASEGYDTTQALIVGSESLLFNHVTEQELIDLIGQVDAATEVPVTTGEPWSIWVDHPNLANAVDFIGIHVHPYWEDIPIDDAAQYVIDKYNAVQQAYPDKEVVILETGWPSAGDVHGPAVPSDANQAQFLVDFVPLAEAQNVKYFIFEAFDEPWKQKYGEVEGHWGLHYEDRTPKPALDGILAPMRVDSVGVRPCGFVVHFTSGPDSAVLNLYDTGASAYGPADMTVVGDTVGPVAGSLVYNEETSTVTFVKTGGPLLADTYTVTLVSRPDGFKDVSGRLLDGDADGVEGGDYVTTVTVESSTGRIVSVPDVTRGPGQDVNIPAADSGIPITIDDGINVEAVSFVFEYDPTLLTVTGASAAPGLAGNWVVDYDLIMPGRVSVTAGGSVALAAGENELVRLQAAIPADAPYKSTAILRLEDLNINGAVIEVAPDCGLQVVAYIGDASGNRAYSDYDADLILRVSVASDSGFAAYPMMDPVLIGDVTGNGTVSATDASHVAAKAANPQEPHPYIPDIPTLPYPTVSVPMDLSGYRGSTVTVPILLDDATDLARADIHLRYNTNVFDLDDSSVSVGDLTLGWSIVPSVDDASGQVSIVVTGVDPLTGGSGRLAELEFSVLEDAPLGTTTIDLLNGSSLNEGQLFFVLQGGEVTILDSDLPPRLETWSLSEDTGSDPDDKLTNDTTPQLTVVFSEAVFGDNTDIQVTDPGSASVVADSITGWGSDTLVVSFSTPLTAEGLYTVVLKGTETITDDQGNPLNGGVDEEVQFRLDVMAPEVAVHPLKTDDSRPELTGTVDDAAASIDVTVAGRSYAATNNGDGSWTLADNTINPALTEGVYDVVVNAVDPAGNTGTDTTSDELEITGHAPQLFYEDFESGWGDWSTDHGVWEIGSPTAGPDGAQEGTRCAGTSLDGDYPMYTDSRLISPQIDLPVVSGEERLELRFFQWYSYAEEQGDIQISVWDDGVWSEWETLANAAQGDASSGWSRSHVDLTAYAGQRVRVAFYHRADFFVSSGWYIDEVELWRGVPAFTNPETFESGWGDWWTDHGVWQIGSPTAGPEAAYEGSGCAGTDLDGEYPRYTDSRLISPQMDLPSLSDEERLEFRFFQWYSYAEEQGDIQISVWDDGVWSEWETLANAAQGDASSGWSRSHVDLTAYAGQRVRVAFYHRADFFVSSGWYIDEVELWRGVPAFTSPIYRFWSPVNSVHFYTISEAERDMLIQDWPSVWTYEGIAYQAFVDGGQAGTAPIYRFWSGHSHFYTISEAERDMLIQDWPSVWTYEGIAFYAYPEGQQPEGSKPVYRFWNGSRVCHFYTMSETERDMIIRDFSHVFSYEGVAWYAEAPLDGVALTMDNQAGLLDSRSAQANSGESQSEPLPRLPGMRLVDPNPANLTGQVIYLDFDGEQNVTYNGPVTVGPFDVPAFQATGSLAGQEQMIISGVLGQLQQTFADCGVTFTADKPSGGVVYSSVYVGGDDSTFAPYGLFFGLAEQVDVGNRARDDDALVFTDCLGQYMLDMDSLTDRLTRIIAHEVGHLLGYAHA